jgi:hypothetical protein
LVTTYLRYFDRLSTGLLLLLHRLAAAAQIAFAALGNDHLRAALRALVTLPYLIRHYFSILRMVSGFLYGRPSGEYSASVTRASTWKPGGTGYSTVKAARMPKS